MIKDFTLGNNLKNIIGKFMRLSFVFSMIILSGEIFTSVYLYFQKEKYLTNNEISSFILIGCIPILLFTISFLIYENLYPAKKTNMIIKLKVLFWIFYLFIPSLILLYRYTDLVNTFAYIGIFITIIGFIGISDKSLNSFKIINIFNEVKYIMFDFWKKRDINKEKEHFESNLITERQPLYVDKEGLNIFQNTISCPLIDVNTIIEKKYLEKLEGAITVLDIGGAEGKFTSNLLKEYIATKPNNSVSKIQLVDPVDLKNEYTNNLSSILNTTILNSITTIEDWEQQSAEQYDLVIASHSLYASIDNSKISFPALINKLKKYVSDNGILLIVLGSREGRAYSFKKEALEYIFGEGNPDAESNSFINRLTENNIKFQRVQTDNYIDLTILMKQHEEGHSTALINWLSYFLRVDKKNLIPANTFTQIVELLEYYMQPLYELPNFEIDNFTKLNYPNTMDKNNSLLLLHKTDIIII